MEAPKTIGFTGDETATALCRMFAGGILVSSFLTRAERGAVLAITFKTHLFLDVVNAF